MYCLAIFSCVCQAQDILSSRICLSCKLHLSFYTWKYWLYWSCRSILFLRKQWPEYCKFLGAFYYNSTIHIICFILQYLFRQEKKKDYIIYKNTKKHLFKPNCYFRIDGNNLFLLWFEIAEFLIQISGNCFWHGSAYGAFNHRGILVLITHVKKPLLASLLLNPQTSLSSRLGSNITPQCWSTPLFYRSGRNPAGGTNGHGFCDNVKRDGREC